MRILITGANGQVGQALLRAAKEQSNIDIIAYSKDNLDISSASMVMGTLQRHQPDLLINAAAYTNVERAEDEKALAYTVNAEGVAYLAQACRSLDIPLLHISTDYVFSGTKTSPYDETDATSPLNIYGASKLAGEKYVIEGIKEHIILRTSWVFSATGNNFLKTMYRLFHERTEVKVVNDQWGGPTSADAIAKTLLSIAERVLDPNFTDWGIYHYSGSPSTTWHDFAEQILQHCLAGKLSCQKLSPISTAQFPTKASRPRYTVFNLEKIKRVFGIAPANWEQDLGTLTQLLEKENAT